MKIIFSRKGLDSSFGPYPSPIFSDGTLFSIPIPRSSHISFEDLSFAGHRIPKIIEDLSSGEIKGHDGCHLDPDLNPDTYPRMGGWRPLFGQRGTAARHLFENEVSIGDLFLFFGWFREVEIQNGIYRYLPGAGDIHALFGWLQVGEVLNVIERGHDIPQWAAYHPHFHSDYGKNNVVYVASELLDLDGEVEQIPGGGTFPTFCEELSLTAPHRSRSWWRLPNWFFPGDDKPPLTYHSNSSRWQVKNDLVYLRTVPRGQEFVLDVDYYPEAISWIRSIIVSAA